MRNFIIYDGVDSRDYGIYISGSEVFNAPAKGYEMQEVPGRSGDLILDNGRYENIELTYPAFAYAQFAIAMREWLSFLLSRNGYCKLADTYHPDEYRLAAFVGPVTVEPTDNLRAGRFDMTFACKPQRFLMSGDDVQTFSASGTIENPTLFPAKPLIQVTGSGAVTIGGVTLTISGAPVSTVTIDCERMDAYAGGANMNRYVKSNTNTFPEIPPGESAITLGAGVASVAITPRWWRL